MRCDDGGGVLKLALANDERIFSLWGSSSSRTMENQRTVAQTVLILHLKWKLVDYIYHLCIYALSSATCQLALMRLNLNRLAGVGVQHLELLSYNYLIFLFLFFFLTRSKAETVQINPNGERG